jgi:selenocysteine lyase/cysteine desulfurase
MEVSYFRLNRTSERQEIFSRPILASGVYDHATYFAQSRKEAHIITTAIEHPAILAPWRFIEH